MASYVELSAFYFSQVNTSLPYYYKFKLYFLFGEKNLTAYFQCRQKPFYIFLSKFFIFFHIVVSLDRSTMKFRVKIKNEKEAKKYIESSTEYNHAVTKISIHWTKFWIWCLKMNWIWTGYSINFNDYYFVCDSRRYLNDIKQTKKQNHIHKSTSFYYYTSAILYHTFKENKFFFYSYFFS